MISLKKVNGENIWKIVRLKVKDSQENFVATNTESILEAYTTITSGGVALPFGIYDGSIPVGFLMLGYGEQPDEGNPDIAKGNYCLWRFMIDEKYQGKGYSKAAMEKTLEYIRTFPCGHGEFCWLSYEPENEVAKKLYTSFGFLENGEVIGGEIVSVLRL